MSKQIMIIHPDNCLSDEMRQTVETEDKEKLLTIT